MGERREDDNTGTNYPAPYARPDNNFKNRNGLGKSTDTQVGAVEESSLRTLKVISLLHDLPSSALQALEQKCQWSHFDAGEVLIERGQSTEDVFFLVSGKARVVNYSVSGRVVSYALLNTGDCFGELAAIDGMARSATVKTDTPCIIAVLCGLRFRQLILSEPKIAMAFLQHLAGIVRACDERIFDLVTLDAKQRVCMELLRLAQPDAADLTKLVIYPIPTQDAIARNVGITRRTVSRVFRSLMDDQRITKKNKTLLIVDREYLENKLFRRQN